MPLQESFTGNTDGAVTMSNSSRWAAQSFKAESAYEISSVKLLLYRATTPGTVTVSIRDASGDRPTGGDLAVGTTDGDTLTTDTAGEQREITFVSPYALSNNIKYCIVIRPAAGFLGWRGTASTPTYANGDNSYSFNSGGSWTTHAGVIDHWFENYNSVSPPGKARFPNPVDNKEDERVRGIDQLKQLSWSAPSNETPDYKLYFRLKGGSWVLYDTIEYIIAPLYILLPAITLDYYDIYEWRVDTYDPGTGLTTTGDTWTFITETDRRWTEYTRRSDYDEDKVWQPGTGFVDINTFEYTGGGRYKGRVLVIGHKVIYFGDL